MSAPRKDVEIALEPDPMQITFWQRTIGAFCLTSFVAIWIASIASPFILAATTYLGYYSLAIVIVLISIIAYLPWEKGILANSVRYVIKTYTPCYFKSIVMAFQGGLPKQSNTTTDKNDRKKSDDNNVEPQTFYAIHPHGAFCIGWAMLFCHDVMQHVRFCFAPALYASPFFRVFARVTGNPGSAAKFAMQSYLQRGESVALPPGGFEEATLSCTTQDRVFIRKRTGFIRLCLQYGVRVRPVYVFGEKDCYWNIQGCFRQRLAVNRYGIPTIVPWGCAWCPLLPRRNVPLHIVVGPPITMPHIRHPSPQDVQKWHATYIVALQKLFDEHKELHDNGANKEMKLEIW